MKTAQNPLPVVSFVEDDFDLAFPKQSVANIKNAAKQATARLQKEKGRQRRSSVADVTPPITPLLPPEPEKPPIQARAISAPPLGTPAVAVHGPIPVPVMRHASRPAGDAYRKPSYAAMRIPPPRPAVVNAVRIIIGLIGLGLTLWLYMLVDGFIN